MASVGVTPIFLSAFSAEVFSFGSILARIMAVLGMTIWLMICFNANGIPNGIQNQMPQKYQDGPIIALRD